MAETATTKRSHYTGKSPHRHHRSNHVGSFLGTNRGISTISSTEASGFLASIQPKLTKETLQTKETLGASPTASPSVECHINSRHGGGQTLPESARSFFEPRFGYDFSGVRVHTDVEAAKSARAVNAQAYTIGNDVVFGAGLYAPETAAGKSLLAHELTHVVQQRSGNHSAGSPLPQIQRQSWYPFKPETAKMAPVFIRGGLINDELPRASMMVEPTTTIRKIARKVLPTFNGAAPYQTPAGGAPIAVAPLTEDELARALLVFNQFHLPAKTMANFKAGFRFPLPIRITFTGEWLVHPNGIRALANTFAHDEALLDQMPAPGAAPANLPDQARQFLADHPPALARGIHLHARLLTNAKEALPFIREVFNQLGRDGFEPALELMNNMVNHQAGLLASLREGYEILRILHAVLQAAPAKLSPEQAFWWERANRMLTRFAVPKIELNPEAVQPRGIGGDDTATVVISGAPPGIAVAPTVTAAANSGGHQHHPGRPVGTITPRSKTTDGAGKAEFSYRSNTPGGIETITVVISGTQARKDIEVRVPDLAELPPSPDYDLTGTTATHPDNHFGTADTLASLQQIAQEYEAHKRDNGLADWPLIGYNDISLERGGIFDIDGNWRPPHQEHRAGTIVDFRTRGLNNAQKNVLRTIIQNNGGRILNEGDHWHIRF